MAGASDKARFYLEQSVPELKEYERKNIFTSEEISSIAKRRSDFEHILNARGCQPSDYARYAEFEINVDSLRRKRVSRLKIKTPAHNGRRRIFFIMERATRKFPGDMALWMQQLEYAQRQKAHKKLSQIITRALRLHPTKAELWIFAAQVAMEEYGDVSEARNYMQRGLRFCKASKNLWLEYARLELLYIAKIAARRQILGLDGKPEGGPTQSSSPKEQQLPAGDTSGSGYHLLSADTTDDNSSQNPARTSIMSGAIPITIFDAAMCRFDSDEEFALSFFDTVVGVDAVLCARSILTHVVNHMAKSKPDSWRTLICKIKLACVGIDIKSPEFPQSFRNSWRMLHNAPPEIRSSRQVTDAIQNWLQSFLSDESLDVALRQIMLSTSRDLQRAMSLGSPSLELLG